MGLERQPTRVEVDVGISWGPVAQHLGGWVAGGYVSHHSATVSALVLLLGPCGTC